MSSAFGGWPRGLNWAHGWEAISVCRQLRAAAIGRDGASRNKRSRGSGRVCGAVIGHAGQWGNRKLLYRVCNTKGDHQPESRVRESSTPQPGKTNRRHQPKRKSLSHQGAANFVQKFNLRRKIFVYKQRFCISKQKI